MVSKSVRVGSFCVFLAALVVGGLPSAFANADLADPSATSSEDSRPLNFSVCPEADCGQPFQLAQNGDEYDPLAPIDDEVDPLAPIEDDFDPLAPIEDFEDVEGDAVYESEGDSVDESDDDTEWVDVEIEGLDNEDGVIYEDVFEDEDEVEDDTSTTARPTTGGGGETATATALGLDLAQDSPKWCTYQDGTTTGTPLTPIDDDGDDPRDTPPPDDDDGDDPRDVKPPCDELRAELEKTLRDVVAAIDRPLGSNEVGLSPEGVAATNAIREELEAALEELDNICPRDDDGDDPRDTPPPDDDDGDDPRDVKPPCEERRDELEAEFEALIEENAALEEAGQSGSARHKEVNARGKLVGQILEELWNICPEDDDGDDPRDTPPPDDDDGDDPRDVKPPCEERRDELEAEFEALIEENAALEEAGQSGSARHKEVNARGELVGQILEELWNICPGDDDGDDPRDVKPPCVERIKALTAKYSDLIARGKSGEIDYETYKSELDALDQEGEAIDEDCPGDDDGDDPRDVGQPDDDDGDDPRDVVPTVTVVVKAKTSVLQDGGMISVPKAGQMMKLIPSATSDMALPGDGVTQETALDSDRDPMQGRTGADGWLPFEIELDPREWPENMRDNVGRMYDLVTSTSAALLDMERRAVEVTGSTCATGLRAVGTLFDRAANGLETLCTDPGQAAENFCNNVERGVDRLITKGERIVDDPLGCVARGTERIADTVLGLLGEITGIEFEADVDVEEETSTNVEVTDEDAAESAAESAPVEVNQVTTIGDRTWVTLTYDPSQAGAVQEWINSIGGEVVNAQENYCRDKQAKLNDPYMSSKGSWGQSWADQWAIQRVGFTNGKDSAWDLVGKNPKPVVVAVIDTGLDWHHLDIDWKNIWRNEGEIPDNGKDDDANGYVDDVIGWDFFANNNYPWDHDGHGTIVAGIIAAKQNNGHGIAGVNPHVKIMVLKGMNSFGHTRASYLAKAITYAADNGADVINMSVGGANYTDIEQAAIDYAYAKGVTIVVAAGNEALDVSEWGTAGSEKVITVAATDRKDKRAVYSNFGKGIDIAAPGDDVMSLRARRTDTMLDIEGVEYEARTAYVGEDKRYYRASGTSFAAPIVTGVASLLLSKSPELTPAQVKRILQQSAEDIEDTGVDMLTGHGLVDARAALKADVNYRIEAMIDGVEVVQSNGRVLIQVNGTADADRLAKAYVEIGAGEEPANWKTVINPVQAPVRSGSLGQFDAGHLAGSPIWMIRVVVRHEDGSYRVNIFRLQLG